MRGKMIKFSNLFTMVLPKVLPGSACRGGFQINRSLGYLEAEAAEKVVTVITQNGGSDPQCSDPRQSSFLIRWGRKVSSSPTEAIVSDD